MELRFWVKIHGFFLHEGGRKNTTRPNDFIDFSNSTFRGAKISKMSFSENFKTSPALTPYYSRGIQEICSTSQLKGKRQPREPGNTCASMGKLRIWGVKRFTKSEFWDDFWRFFPEASGGFWMVWMIDFDVFWCPGGPQTIPEWFWIDFGNIIFRPKNSQKLTLWKKLPCKKTHIKNENPEDLRVGNRSQTHLALLFSRILNSNG